MAFDPARIPDALKKAYVGKRCAVLVGAGASAGSGLPTWGDLLEKMTAVGEGHRVVTPEKAEEYRKLLADPSKYLMVAGGLKEDVHLYFDEFVEDTFVKSKPQITDLHKALVSLEALQFVVTTNYDTLIEKAYRQADEDVSVLTFRGVGELQRRLSRREFFILKAHGDASAPGEGIILTELDYRHILYRHRGYQGLLSAMFTMFSIVFVGASMADPEIRLLLNYVADSFAQGSGPSHYALLADEEITSVEKERWFKDLNVQIIPISKADGYAEATEFLQTLAATK